ncbi:ABC transporter substrate-binding protein [Streptomyces sp. TRM66268-LWL]|uniref:ABC transporter substrate-binding protein n=1 Tax=Streptomyces polyasparticus TaxID=2767826 RepID=A0ABR7SCJ9_9ACTN|nr:ABC transporter substrate-binding protein [Streptomyces polyasparticus]MBC9713210.1 ABC transporter substrate-binding protein [Streptomyces polyasparticus]
MPRSRFLSGAVTVAALSLAASACTTGPAGGPSSDGDGSGGGTVRIGFTSDVTSFDPAKGAGATDYALTSLLYQPLIGQDDGGAFVPGLAEKWTSTPTKTTLTLKKGLTCSDGSPLTASQTVASLRRYQAESAGALLTFGPANAGEKTTITGDDKTGTVTITTSAPWGEVLAGLSGTAAGIVCKAGLDAGDALARGAVEGAATGPYEMAKAQRGASYELRLRKGYTVFPQYAAVPAGEPAGRLRIQIAKNESTLANQLQTGALDLAPFTGTDAKRFGDSDNGSDNGTFTVKSAPLIRHYVGFNQRSGRPGADPKIRKAVAQALSVDAFNNVFGGTGQKLTSYVDDKAPCVSTDSSLLTGTDKAAARQVLKGVVIKLEGSNAVAGGAGNSYVAEALRAAGADVKLTNADNATWATDVTANQGDWDLTVFPLISGALARGGAYFLGPEPAEGGLNYGAVQNTAYARHYVAATSVTDRNAKCAAWQKAQEALLTSHDVIPLATVDVHYATRKGISFATPTGALSLSTLRVTG